MNSVSLESMARPVSRDGRAAVWIVEDNELYLRTLCELLEHAERMRCTRTFANGEGLLRALDQGDDLPHLILMDLALPGISGIDCIREVRERASAIPVVMLTVHQSNDRIFESICAGASGYLLKSATGEDILRSLETVFDGGAAINAQIARRVLDMFSGLAKPQNDYGLSAREQQILQLLVDGRTKAEIAEQLFLSPHTIDGHVRNIYTKLHVNNRSRAVAKALRERLL